MLGGSKLKVKVTAKELRRQWKLSQLALEAVLKHDQITNTAQSLWV